MGPVRSFKVSFFLPLPCNVIPESFPFVIVSLCSWGSVLPIVRRSRDAESFHLVKQCGALQAKSRGGSPRASELSILALTSRENLLTYFVLQRWVWNLDPWGLAFFRRHRV